MKYISIILTGIFILCFLNADARSYNKHEVYFSGGFGIHDFHYKVDDVSNSLHPGGMIGLGYMFFLNKNWGISTGVEGAYYQRSVNVPEFTSIIHGLNDGEGHAFDYHSRVRNYTEKQYAYMVSIPLLATYQVGKFNQFFVMGGMKVGFPFGGYQSTGTYMHKGYFPERDNWAVDQKFMGFGVFPDEKNKDRLSYKPSFMVTLELGAKLYTDGIWSIYTGIYGEYGLNSILSNDREELISYQPGSKRIITNGSVLETQYTNNDKQVIQFTDKIVPVSVGLKIRVSMGW